MLLARLYIIFGEISIPVICPFLNQYLEAFVSVLPISPDIWRRQRWPDQSSPSRGREQQGLPQEAPGWGLLAAVGRVTETPELCPLPAVSVCSGFTQVRCWGYSFPFPAVTNHHKLSGLRSIILEVGGPKWAPRLLEAPGEAPASLPFPAFRGPVLHPQGQRAHLATPARCTLGTRVFAHTPSTCVRAHAQGARSWEGACCPDPVSQAGSSPSPRRDPFPHLLDLR